MFYLFYEKQTCRIFFHVLQQKLVKFNKSGYFESIGPKTRERSDRKYIKKNLNPLLLKQLYALLLVILFPSNLVGKKL